MKKSDCKEDNIIVELRDEDEYNKFYNDLSSRLSNKETNFIWDPKKKLSTKYLTDLMIELEEDNDLNTTDLQIVHVPGTGHFGLKITQSI
jgi:hypothetical protein